MRNNPSSDDWPRPVSRKTSEDDVKKSFLFEPQASLNEFRRNGTSLEVFNPKKMWVHDSSRRQEIVGLYLSVIRDFTFRPK